MPDVKTGERFISGRTDVRLEVDTTRQLVVRVAMILPVVVFQALSLRSPVARVWRTALRHAWLSFPMVADITTSINLVSELAK